MTHAQVIEISNVYIALSLLCFSQYNLNWHYITWYLICSHLFENHKLIPRSFLIFNRMSLRLQCEKIPECQMTFIFLIKYIQIFYSLSYWLMLKIHLPQPPQNVLELNTNVQIIFDLFFSTIDHFQFLSAFSRVKSILFILFVAPWRPATSMFLVNFKEDYMSSITDICSTNLCIPSSFGT